VRAVKVRAAVLVDEVVGLAIRSKMDSMSLLLEIMPEVEAAGRVPEPFTADYEEDVHVFLPDDYVLINDEIVILATGVTKGRYCPRITGFFRDDDPCDDIDNNADAKGEERDGDPYQPDDREVDIEVFSKSGADTPQYPVPC